MRVRLLCKKCILCVRVTCHSSRLTEAMLIIQYCSYRIFWCGHLQSHDMSTFLWNDSVWGFVENESKTTLSSLTSITRNHQPQLLAGSLARIVRATLYVKVVLNVCGWWRKEQTWKMSKRILHECSCMTEFIKRVGEKDKIRGFAQHISIGFSQEFDKFNNYTGFYLSYDTKNTFYSRFSYPNVKIPPLVNA